MNRRKSEIEAAKKEAKKRDRVCFVCGSDEPWGRCWGDLDGAHLIPTNSPFSNWDPAEPLNIFPLHRSAHSASGNDSYDENKTLESRASWIERRVRKREHKERLIARLNFVYGESVPEETAGGSLRARASAVRAAGAGSEVCPSGAALAV